MSAPERPSTIPHISVTDVLMLIGHTTNNLTNKNECYEKRIYNEAISNK